MKVVILADTHIKDPADAKKLLEFTNGADFIIHAGDFTSAAVVEHLQKSGKFTGVRGNNDSVDMKDRLRKKEIFRLAGYTIGVFHGHGEGKKTAGRAYEKFVDDNVDIIVFGHSHQPAIFTKNNILMLNPGSPRKKMKERWYSYILLHLLPTGVQAELRLSDRSFV